MKRILFQITAVTLVFLFVFLVLGAAGFEEWITPFLEGRAATVATAILMFTLLAADVLLPVPSSLVMTANGALFGVVIGALISVLGSISASCFGYLLGRAEFTRKFFASKEGERFERKFISSEMMLIILTRPLPLLAEATSVLAGARKMNFKVFTTASAIGAVPISFLYAFIGSGTVKNQSPMIFLLTYLIVAGAAFAAAKVFQKNSS